MLTLTTELGRQALRRRRTRRQERRPSQSFPILSRRLELLQVANETSSTHSDDMTAKTRRKTCRGKDVSNELGHVRERDD